MQTIFRKFILWIRFIAFGQFNQLTWVDFPPYYAVRYCKQTEPYAKKIPLYLEIYQRQAFLKMKHCDDFGKIDINYDDDEFNSLTDRKAQQDYLSKLMTPDQFSSYCQSLFDFALAGEIMGGTVVMGNQEGEEAFFVYSKDKWDRRVIFFHANTKRYWSGWKLSKAKYEKLMKDHVLKIGQKKFLSINQNLQKMNLEFKEVSASDYDYEAYCKLVKKLKSSVEKTEEELKSSAEERMLNRDALVSYEIMIENQVFYNNRMKYLTLLKRYQNKEINSFGVECLFAAIHRKDNAFVDNLLENLETLADFEISSKSDGFVEIIDQLHGVCEIVSDPEYFLSEKEFDEYISQIISELELYS